MSTSRSATAFLAAFILGLGAGIRLDLPSVLAPAAFPAALLAPRRLRRPLLCAACLMAGIWYVGWWRDRRMAEPRVDAPVDFEAVIVEPPDPRADSTYLTVRPVRASDAFGSGSGRILAKVPKFPTWTYGDRIALVGTLRKPEAFDGFDYPVYLERYGIYASMPRPRSVRRIAGNQGNPLMAGLYRLRGTLEGRVESAVPEPEASLLNGILLGSKRSIPQDIQDSLRTTGTSHIVAISGANITILLGIALGLLPVVGQRGQLVATAALGGFVSLLTGASASVLRGAEVAVLGRYVRASSRRLAPAPFLVLSALLLLLANPLMLSADTGFQLSFGAFAGLTYLGGPLAGAIGRIPGLRNLPEAVRGALAETVAATTGTAPISLLAFGQLSLLGLIVNPLILWLLPPITALGLGLLTFGWLRPLAGGLGLPLWLMLHAVLRTIAGFGRLTFATITLPHG